MNNCITVANIDDVKDSGYTPNQIKNAYSLSDGIHIPKKVKVATIDFIGNKYIQNNLRIFSEKFNLPSTTINYIDSDKKSDYFNFGAYIEPCVDTQWIHAISPFAELYVIRASEYSVLGAMDAIKALLPENMDIILLTFQAPFEEEYIEFSSIFEENTVFVVSAGDTGAGAFFPACFPNCISVGGTSLSISKEGKREGEETVWDRTGGGICENFDIPLYQKIFNGISSITNGKRGVPDVAFFADTNPGYAVYHSSVGDNYGWYNVGGTSLSASVIAGIISNLLSSRQFENKKQVLPYLYSLAGKTSYQNSVYYKDIVTGNNGTYHAKNGYDLCTGLGSLNNI